MSVIIILVGNNIQENEEDDEEKLPGEEWMYDNDVNTGLY